MAGETDSGRPAPGAVLARIAGAIGIAAEGVALSLGLAVVGIILIALGLEWTGRDPGTGAIPIALFFRDPDRYPARTENVVISGADGKVTDISDVSFPGSAGRLYHRVSVFMSPLNVHVNRAPVGGEVTSVEHTAGDFRAAFRDDASEHNERNLIAMTDASGRMFAMLSGRISRAANCLPAARA